MSADYEHGGFAQFPAGHAGLASDRSSMPDGSAYVPLKRRGRPKFTTTEEAMAYVREVIAEIGPWPEEVEVTEAAGFQGRLRQVASRHSQEAAKMHAVCYAVRCKLEFLDMMVRMPQLALVSGNLAELLWESSKTYEVITEEPAAPGPRDMILAELRKAGDKGVLASYLFEQVTAEPLRETGAYLSRDAFRAYLGQLRDEDLADSDQFGRWRALPDRLPGGCTS